MFGLSNESQYSPRESNRSRLNSYDLGAKHEDGYRCDDADGFHKVIVAVAIPVFAAIAVSTETLRKKSMIVMRYDLLLRTSHGCIP